MGLIRIVSDGTLSGSHVYDEETGSEIKGIIEAQWKMSATRGSPPAARAVIVVDCAEIEFKGPGRIRKNKAVKK